MGQRRTHSWEQKSFQYLIQKQHSQVGVCVFQRVHLLDQIVSIRQKRKTMNSFLSKMMFEINIPTPHHPSSVSPCIDLQRGLQNLSSLLGGAGQLLGAEEVASCTHLQHGDHSRVCVQSRSQLETEYGSGYTA